MFSVPFDRGKVRIIYSGWKSKQREEEDVPSPLPSVALPPMGGGSLFVFIFLGIGVWNNFSTSSREIERERERWTVISLSRARAMGGLDHEEKLRPAAGSVCARLYCMCSGFEPRNSILGDGTRWILSTWWKLWETRVSTMCAIYILAQSDTYTFRQLFIFN